MMQIAPFLKGFGTLNTFSLFERLRFKAFQAVNQHQVELQSELFTGFSRLPSVLTSGALGLCEAINFSAKVANAS